MGVLRFLSAYDNKEIWMEIFWCMFISRNIQKTWDNTVNMLKAVNFSMLLKFTRIVCVF